MVFRFGLLNSTPSTLPPFQRLELLMQQLCGDLNRKATVSLFSASINITHPEPKQHLALHTKANAKTTSMHFSRMRTVRLLPVSPSMHCAGGSVCSGGNVCSGGCLLRGVCLLPGGCRASAPRGGVGVSSQGVSAPGSVSQHAMGQTPPRGQTDTCDNITFANFVCGR